MNRISESHISKEPLVFQDKNGKPRSFRKKDKKQKNIKDNSEQSWQRVLNSSYEFDLRKKEFQKNYDLNKELENKMLNSDVISQKRQSRFQNNEYNEEYKRNLSSIRNTNNNKRKIRPNSIEKELYFWKDKNRNDRKTLTNLMNEIDQLNYVILYLYIYQFKKFNYKNIT